MKDCIQNVREFMMACEDVSTSTTDPKMSKGEEDLAIREGAAQRATGSRSSIAVSANTYEELRNKLNPVRILFDEEIGREFLAPTAIFRSAFDGHELMRTGRVIVKDGQNFTVISGSNLRYSCVEPSDAGVNSVRFVTDYRELGLR